jgi:hypothetical protein
MTSVSKFLDVQDLFAAGLGFDLAGALLLARGLLASPRNIARRTGSYYGYNAWATVSEAHDRVDAVSGLVAFGIGFILQATGYVSELGHTFNHSAFRGKALVGIVVAALAFVTVLAVWAAIRAILVKRLLVGIAHYPLDEDTRLQFPLGARLQAFGEALGESVRDGEDSLAYLRRVFQVRDAFYGERPFWRGTDGPPA